MKKLSWFLLATLACNSCGYFGKKERKSTEPKHSALVSFLNIGTQYYDEKAKSKKLLWDNREPVISEEIRFRIQNSIANVSKNKLIGLVEMNLKTLSDIDQLVKDNGYSYVFQSYSNLGDIARSEKDKEFDDQPLAVKFKKILADHHVDFAGYDVFKYPAMVRDQLQGLGELLVLIYNPAYFSVKDVSSIYLKKGTYLNDANEEVLQRNDRAAMRVVLDELYGQQDLIVYLTHLDHQSATGRVDNVKTLSRMVADEKINGNKALILGDWNCFDQNGKQDLKIVQPLKDVASDLTSEGIVGFDKCEMPTFVDYPGENRTNEKLCIDRIYGAGGVSAVWGDVQKLKNASDHALVEVLVEY